MKNQTAKGETHAAGSDFQKIANRVSVISIIQNALLLSYLPDYLQIPAQWSATRFTLLQMYSAPLL